MAFFRTERCSTTVLPASSRISVWLFSSKRYSSERPAPRLSAISTKVFSPLPSGASAVTFTSSSSPLQADLDSACSAGCTPDMVMAGRIRA